MSLEDTRARLNQSHLENEDVRNILADLREREAGFSKDLDHWKRAFEDLKHSNENQASKLMERDADVSHSLSEVTYWKTLANEKAESEQELWRRLREKEDHVRDLQG